MRMPIQSHTPETLSESIQPTAESDLANGQSQAEGKGKSGRTPVVDLEKALTELSARRQPESISLWKAIGWSVLVHLLSPFAGGIILGVLIWLVGLIFHWDFWKWLNPPPKADIEFTIVRDTATKTPPQTFKFVGSHNQQAGGTTQESKPAPSEAKKPDTIRRAQAKPTPVKPVEAKPAEAPKPKEKPQATVGTEKSPPPLVMDSNPDPLSQFIKDPDAAAEQGIGDKSTFTPEQGASDQPGVNVAQSDFGPFMADLKRRLNRNWQPPRGNDSNKVVLRFEVARDGSLLDASVETSSGDEDSDYAALQALRNSAPFRYIPEEFSGDRIPVLFTFDYTVLGRSR